MYLIIGANGQLGSEIRHILGDGACYADIEQVDITDEESVDTFVRSVRPSYIINCAAYTNVDKAEEEGAVASRINIDGPRNLARTALEVGAKLLHVSTDYVFDGTGCVPYVESDPTSPVNAYGATKQAGEQAVFSMGGTAAVVRTSWLYSRYGNNFVKTMQRLGAQRESLNVVFDQIGSPTCAADLAQCLIDMAPLVKEGSRELYHYSNEGVTSWYDFALEVMKLSGLACHVQPIRSHLYPTPARRPSYSVMDKAKIKETFGVAIPHWRDSLDSMLQDCGF